MTLQPTKPRILVVDDHPANRLAFQTLLEPLYSVVLAQDGYEALRLTQHHEYAVILLDVRMPGMDGFETAEKLRKRETVRYTSIVFMSAYDKTDLQAKKGYVAGATDYLFSPVDEDLLKLKVATHVQLYLKNQALRLQIEELQGNVRGLQSELDVCCPRHAVHSTIRNLDRQITLLRQKFDEQLP